jgi:predicted transcriptional regulator
MPSRSTKTLVQEIGSALTTEGKSVTEVAEDIGAGMNPVGDWLRVLHEAGLVEFERDGARKLYSKPDEVVLEVEQARGENQ